MPSPLARCFALGALAVVAFACSAKDANNNDRLCTPGAYVFCRCQNRDEGTKLCNPDGQSFQACGPCDGTGIGAGGGGTDGMGGHSSGSSGSSGSGGKGGHGNDGNGGGTGTGSADASTPQKGGADGGRDAGADADPGTDPQNPQNPPGPKPNAPHCQPLTNIAPRVAVQQIADDWPTPIGGTIKDGVYVQTWVVSYTGSSGDQGGIESTMSRQTIEIMGDVGRFVFADGDHDDMAGGFRLTIEDGKATVAYECPAAAPKTFRYDVIGDDLAMYDEQVARFYTRQTGGQP